MVEGDEPPWTKEVGCGSFAPNVHGSRRSDLSRVWLSTRIQPKVYNMYVRLYKKQTKEKEKKVRLLGLMLRSEEE